MVSGKGPEELVEVEPDGIRVTIPFKGFGNDSEQLVYGKSFFVGWTGAAQDFPAKLKIDFGKLTVHNALDTPQGFDTSLGVPPGEYGLYLDVNGFWKYLNDWAPGLNAVNDGDSFQLNRSVEINVPAGKGLRLMGEGRECDLPRIAPCPATSEAAEDNDNPGSVTDEYPSVAAALGNHTLKPSTNHWELDYSISLIRPAGSTGCFDTFLPRSRILRRGPHVVGSRFVFAGVGVDRDCGGGGLAPRRVRVSVARLVPPISSPSVARYEGDRCRFLKRGGAFSATRSCTEMGFLRAQGTSSWTFARKANSIAPGTYLIRTRAVDGAGNVEYVNVRRNRLAFTVR